MKPLNIEMLDQLYLNGNYQNILELISDIDFTLVNKSHNIELAVAISYKSRSLIRLGRIKESIQLINNLERNFLNITSQLSDLINDTTLMNNLITIGKSKDVLSRYKSYSFIEDFINQIIKQYGSKYNFWIAYLYYLIGIANYYELNHEDSIKHFLKSININTSNQLIKGKCYYYLGFIHLELNNESSFNLYIDKSMDIYDKIGAKQGIAWIFLWKGNLAIQKGNYSTATQFLNQSLELFKKVGSNVECDLIQSLFGLIAFHKGDLDKATKLLNNSFSSSIKLGNPMISSYILLPFIHVNIDTGNRHIIKGKLEEFENFNKDSRVAFHLQLGKAIYLKSSNRFIDKAEAQKILLELLNKSGTESNYLFTTGDKSVRFYLTMNLAEIYYQEFVISHDLSILKEIQVLIENFKKSKDQEITKELIEIAMLNSKIYIVEGKISNALDELKNARRIAIQHDYIQFIERINSEIIALYSEIDKWETDMDLLKRISAVNMEMYIKEAQKLAKS